VDRISEETMNDSLELLEVQLLVDKKVVIETLNRIGICNRKKQILYPSCYLYEKDDKVYLAHFKQLFLLTRNNAYNAICEDDLLRRNAIAFCLSQWNLIQVDEEKIQPHDKFVFILPYNQKKDWQIQHKINFRNINMNEDEKSYE
jgi:hypothetical protein